jgi:hypothetical protein
MRISMRTGLMARLKILEAAAAPTKPIHVRYGWLTRGLPEDYQGERHLVAVNCTPSNSDGFDWCEFEERPGPEPIGLR